MNEVIRNMLTRRSVRAYTDAPIEKEKLDAILEAGLYAASGKNLQPVTLVLVTDRAMRDRLCDMNRRVLGMTTGDPFYGAPVLIVVLTDTALGMTSLEDGALALGNMMNAAHSLGVSSCWIHRARQMFESDEGKALLREWGLPESCVGVGNCILGYSPEPLPEAKPRREGRVITVG